MKIKLVPAPNFCNPLSCPINKALRKKGIFALVGIKSFVGLFLWFIPIWGRFSYEVTKEAHKEMLVDTQREFEVELYKSNS